MRIGLIIYGSLETVSGGYLYDRQLVDYLRGQGEEVVIISLPWRRYPAHLRDNFSAKWKAQLRAACQDLDLLLQDELNHPSLFWINRWLRREFSMPIISIVHHLRSSEEHLFTSSWFYPLIERAYLKTVDGFIFNSQTTKESVQQLLGKEASGVAAYPAADHLATQRATSEIRAKSTGQAKSTPLRVLCVGNVSVRKGIHTVLSALVLAPLGTAVVHIVGSLEDKPYVRLLQLQISRHGLTGRVMIWGSLSDEALCERYQEADLLAVPSYEGFGIVYLEAMQYGLPVIGSTAGAAHEIITPGKNGFLVDPHDSRQLAHHLQELHQDRGLLKRMSQAAREQYANHPTWAESMGKVHEWLVKMTR